MLCMKYYTDMNKITPSYLFPDWRQWHLKSKAVAASFATTIDSEELSCSETIRNFASPRVRDFPLLEVNEIFELSCSLVSTPNSREPPACNLTRTIHLLLATICTSSRHKRKRHRTWILRRPWTLGFTFCFKHCNYELGLYCVYRVLREVYSFW